MTTTSDPYAFLRDQLTGIPPLEQMGATIHEPPADQRPHHQPERVIYLPGPGGSSVPVLADHYEATRTPVQSGPAEQPNTTPYRDVWPLRMAAGGASASAVIGTIALAGPHLAEAGHAAEMGGLGIGIAALGTGILVSLLKGAIGSRQAPVNVSVNVTNSPHLSATASSRSHHRSH